MLTVTDKKGRRHSVNVLDVFGTGRTIRKSRTTSNAEEQPTGKSGGKIEKKVEDKKLKETTSKEQATETKKEAGENEVGESTEPQLTSADKDIQKTSVNVTSSVDDTIHAWIEDDDKQLLKFKDENMSWKTIASKLGKAKSEVTKRYGELKRAQAVDKTEATASKTGEENEPTESDVLFLDLDLDDPSVGTDPCMYPGGPKIVRDSKSNGIGSKKDQERSQNFHYEGEGILSVANTVLLTRLHDHYEYQKWIAISSRFFDQTGRRISPETLREQLDKA